MPNITVYVTEDLHQKIKQHKGSLEISQIFAKAMEGAIEMLEKGTEKQPLPQPIGSVGDVLQALVKYARHYRKGALESIRRNQHMNKTGRVQVRLTQNAVDATLVDFINYIAAIHGVDFTLYTSDLGKEEP